MAECCCNVSQEFGSSKKCLATILETLHLWASMDDRDSGAMKSIFLILTERSPTIILPLVRYIWRTKILKKVKFLWLLAYRSLNTHEKLKKNSSTLHSILRCAAFCFNDKETLDDLFLHRAFAMKAWNMLFRIFNLEFCLLSKVDSWVLEGLNGKGFSPKGNIL